MTTTLEGVTLQRYREALQGSDVAGGYRAGHRSPAPASAAA